MFIRRQRLYHECARLIAKEDLKSKDGSDRSMALRTLIYYIDGPEGVTKVNKLSREIRILLENKKKTLD